MQLITVTLADKFAALANNLVMREQEFAQYQMNIDSYTLQLTALPQGDWPADLAAWRSTPTTALPATLSDEEVALIADYQYRDQLTGLLRAERVEQGKVRRIYDALLAQLPQDQASDLIAQAKAQLDAQASA